MPEIDDICSNELQSDEDRISGEFCECQHLLNEHYIGNVTGATKCHALTFNGTVWAACRCTKAVPLQFNIVVMVPDYANNSQITP